VSSSGIGPEQDPFERYYRVEEIERIRWDEERGGGPPREPPEGPRGWAALVWMLFEKVSDFLKQTIQKGLSAAALEPAREPLLLMKAAFETMMAEDRSQDAQFLKRVSKLWLEILEQSVALHASNPWARKLKAFIRDIESYPENEEHTFGYYLDEFAGQRWIPFPYMELLKTLHHQHELDPPSSLLTRWVKMIDEILNRQ